MSRLLIQMGDTTYEVESLNMRLPLPPISLKANRRMGAHWAALAREAEGYKAYCFLCIKTWQSIPEVLSYPIDITLTAYLSKRQWADPGDLGAWAKAGIDALVEAKIIKDDRSKYVDEFRSRIRRDPLDPRLVILITRSMSDG